MFDQVWYPSLEQAEQAQLLVLVRTVIPDSLLLQLLSGWLGPGADANASSGARPMPLPAERGNGSNASPPRTLGSAAAGEEAPPLLGGEGGVGGCGALSLRPPLKDIVHIHRSICSALEGFLREVSERRWQRCL